MGNWMQAQQIERYHRHLVRAGRAVNIEVTARIWIARYARLWRARFEEQVI